MVQIEQIFPPLTWHIRHEALYPDQPFDFVKLNNDFEGIHFGLYADHTLMAIVSLFMQDDVAQFRKLAVLPEAQKSGYGKAIMQYLIDFCKTQNIKMLWCNARVNVLEFYIKLGFSITDQTFSKDGYDFVIMEIKL